MRCLILLLLLIIWLSACGGYTPRPIRCDMNDKPYKETLAACIASTNMTSLTIVNACNFIAWESTKVCVGKPDS